MKVLFLDCIAGISGDMFLASLLDCGLNRRQFFRYLDMLQCTGYKFDIIPVKRHSITGTGVEIRVDKKQPHRHWQNIEYLINQSSLPTTIKENSLRCFKNLAEAEAKVHDVPVNKIHFHEVGAVDSILDIVGAAIALHLLQPDKIYCSTLPLGGGFVQCEHGTMPVPAPATTELVKGMPVKMGPVDTELVTPTGAAIVKTYVNEFTTPQFVVDQVGYGFGSKELEIPNVLRVMLGRTGDKQLFLSEEIGVLECNIDDMNPEWFPYLQELLLQEGALDVYIQNVLMKKGRPGIMVKVICPPLLKENLMRILFRESTTLGIRYRTEKRQVAEREIVVVPTSYGDIRVKVGKTEEGKQNQFAPEYEDCKAAARQYNIPIKEIYKAAIREYEKRL